MVSKKQGDESTFKTLSRFKRKYKKETTDFMQQVPVFPLHPLWMVRKLRECLSPDTVVILDATSAISWFHEHEFTVYKPKTLLSSFGFGSMGYSLPASIGAKLGNPNLNIMCVVGDGSFMMQMGELATAAAYEISVPIIVMNDGYYGVLRRAQHHVYKQRFIGTELNNPDFVKVAKAFGIAGYCIGHPGELQSIVEEAFYHKGPTVIDVPIDIEAMPRSVWKWWKLLRQMTLEKKLREY